MVDTFTAITNARDYYTKRMSQLRTERESFISHYKELTQFLQPRRGRYFITDRDKGNKRHQNIINNKALLAIRTATSGMLAGTMSPSRPWFKYETADRGLMNWASVKEWLFQVELQNQRILNASNFYNMAPKIIGELLQFGTGTMSHTDDFENVARFYTHTVGSYFIAQNEDYKVDTLAREFEMTVLQMVRKFGLRNVSTSVKTLYTNGSYDQWIPITHFVEPNVEDLDLRSPLAKNKRFRSVWYEPGRERNDSGEEFLLVSGFDEFPAYAPRWDVTGEDIYGTNCPGMIALGDTKQLQTQERRKAQGIDKMSNPPMTGPGVLKNKPISSLPGGQTLYDETGTGRNQLRAMYQVALDLQQYRIENEAVERRIDEAFLVDLFLAITNVRGIQPRNELNLTQINEERLLILGPVLQQLHGELLDPLHAKLFRQGMKAGIYPPIPEELENQAIEVRYISTLAQAQQAVTAQGIERLAGYTRGLVEMGYESARDKFDADQSIDVYSEVIGVPPSVVVPDEVVQAKRERDRQLQQAQAALDAGQQAASIAQTAAGAKTDEPNVLTDLQEAAAQ